MAPEVISIQSECDSYGPEAMSTSCADVIITLLRNGIVRNDRDTNTEYIFEMYIIKIFTVNDD